MIRILNAFLRKLYAFLPRREAGTVLILGVASLIAVFLLTLRTIIQWRIQHLYLPWNLLLAWLPLLLAVWSLRLGHRWGWRRWQPWAVATVWLLFLPNAPYILTDLVHLGKKTDHRFWVDLILILLFAWPAFLVGCISLRLMHREVARAANEWIGWLFALAACGLAGVGVYIGRFERWNSWDVLTNPMGLAGDLLSLIAIPLMHPAHRFSVLFGVLIFVGYATLQVQLVRPRWSRSPRGSNSRPPFRSTASSREDGA